MDLRQKPLAWFSIPAKDIGRAVAFYNKVLGLELTVTPHQGVDMAFFPMADDQTGGALCQDARAAGHSGIKVYLNATPDLEPFLDRVPLAGGRVTTGKTPIGGGWGFYAHFTDSEGNELGLWSPE